MFVLAFNIGTVQNVCVSDLLYANNLLERFKIRFILKS